MLAYSSPIRYAFRFVVQRLLMSAAICVTLGLLMWKVIPSDQPLPVLPTARPTQVQPQSEKLRTNRRANSSVPGNVATIFVALAAQLRGGDHAELQIDGEDGWSFYEPRLDYLEARRIPAGVPLFIRITYSGTTWGDRAEAGTITCRSLLTFVENRRYNLWCGDNDRVVMTLLEQTR